MGANESVSAGPDPGGVTVESSFTIEFHEHVPTEKRKWVLNQLVDTGTSVVQVAINDVTYEVGCATRKDLRRLGWALFQTHFPKFYRVIKVSGEAQLSANEYRNPE